MKTFYAIVLAMVLVFGISTGCTQQSPTCASSTFGFGTLSATSGLTASDDVMQASLYNCPESKKLTGFTFYANAAGNALAGIYTDNGGAPDTLVAQTAWTAISAAGVTTLSLSTAVNISAGNYWLVFISNAAAATSNTAIGSSLYIQTPVNIAGPLLSPFSSNGTSAVTPFCVELNANLTCQ